MRTEVVKIIEALNEHNAGKLASFTMKLYENYINNKIVEKDRTFAKRILKIFYPNDEKFQSSPVVLDQQ